MYLCTRLKEIHRGVEQLVARQAHNLEVACSNPASATTEKLDRSSFFRYATAVPFTCSRSQFFASEASLRGPSANPASATTKKLDSIELLLLC